MKSSSSTMLAKTLLAWLQCMLSMFVERVILFFLLKMLHRVTGAILLVTFCALFHFCLHVGL